GKSRVYVSNSLRLLGLPENIKQGLMNGRITEGHTRPLLMLGDKPDEQQTLFTEIMTKKMSVRESEKIARSIAQDKVRKKEFIIDPRIRRFEKRLSENLGTRVQIAQGEKGGKITIDYFTLKDLEGILQAVNKVDYVEGENMMDRYLNEQGREIAQKTLSDSGPIDFITGETKSLHENKPLDEPVQVQTKPQSDTTNIDNGFSVSEKKPEIQNTPNYNHTQKKTDDFFLKPLPQINALDSYHKQPDEEIILAKKSLPEFTHDKGHEITTYHKNSEIQQSADSMKKITSDSVQTPEPARSQNSFTLAKENVQNVEDFIDPDFFNSDVATVTAAEKTNQPDWNNQKHSAQNTPQQNQQNDNRIQYQSNPTQQPALQQNADQYHGNVMRHNNAPQQVVQNHGAVHQQSNTNQYHYQQTQPTYQNPAYVQQQQKKSFLGKLFN
ncbi:MAG: ParB/RepB/Spo0J family partition protein, partial [Minisyncoccia bacterium]